MVAGTRPLGGTIGEAVSSFRRDPILGILLERGGLNVLLSTYMAIPAGERILPDIYEPARRCTTVGMAAANILFGDGEVAAELLGRLLSHGITAPALPGEEG